jgi:hypothetical protein
MATMVRVKVLAPTSGATISTGAVTLGVCLADEIAVMVGTSVPAYRTGSELREALKLLAVKPRAAVVVAAGSVRTFLGVPGLTADALDGAAATEINAVVPTETEVGLIVGADAAVSLDKSGLVLAAIQKAIDAFVTAFGS